MYENWEALERECLGCHNCPLGETRTNLVFGVGRRDARVLFVGEGPGEHEDLQGEPFVGRGGQLLDQYLAVIGLDRAKNIYIANMVKCRPPKNRDPLPAEQEACILWLREQVRLLRPRIIVCLGRIAAQRLIDKNFRVTKQHGQFMEKNGVLMMGTYHPASLLRNPQQKPDAFADFIALREKIQEVCPEVYAQEPADSETKR
ncbi:MAG TPA: uracil-DNA glycosylase [Candidatus Fimivicinus intestinavium]|nr:uracil-DNA glycosylase [Candidatus Fimivicinus intestinavium]